MGAAELLQSLQEETQFCAVVAESPFSTFREVACDRMGQPFHMGPWVGRILLRPMVEIAFLRVRWKYGLDMQRVSPEDAVARSHIPVLLIHGQIDGNIPVRHSRSIHGAAPQSVLWESAGCGSLRSDGCSAAEIRDAGTGVVRRRNGHQCKCFNHKGHAGALRKPCGVLACCCKGCQASIVIPITSGDSSVE
jgi:hypothetical protein